MIKEQGKGFVLQGRMERDERGARERRRGNEEGTYDVEWGEQGRAGGFGEQIEHQ